MIVDDHPLVRKGLAALIAESPDFEVCGDAGARAEALELALQLRPDHLIVDLTLGNDDGMDLIKDLSAQLPSATVLVISMHDEVLYAERALRAGALGYLMKDQSGDLALAALKKISDGEMYLSESMSNRLLKRSLRPGENSETGDVTSNFSDREMQVFSRLGDGHAASRIAKDLNLSIKTVEYYRDRLKAKLDMATSAELVQFAIRWKQRMT
ncbi:unnamed protein product [uncultured bacterium]|nr:unnamed protein product [uncultured bacterium]